MIGLDGKLSPGLVTVKTTDNRGQTVDEIAERCVNRIVSISSTADPIIRQQAEAYKDSIRTLIRAYMQEAVMSDRTTLSAKLRSMGLDEIANMLRTV